MMKDARAWKCYEVFRKDENEFSLYNRCTLRLIYYETIYVVKGLSDSFNGTLNLWVRSGCPFQVRMRPKPYVRTSGYLGGAFAMLMQICLCLVGFFNRKAVFMQSNPKYLPNEGIITFISFSSGLGHN